MNKDFLKFTTYLAASDELIEQASKEEIAEVARVLALHVAHYRARYGDVSIDESLEMLRTEKISDEMAKTLADAFGILVEVLKALGTPDDMHSPDQLPACHRSGLRVVLAYRINPDLLAGTLPSWSSRLLRQRILNIRH